MATYRSSMPRRARFVTEYMIDLNGKQAAIRAGYEPRSAEFRASKLLALPEIQAAVADAQVARAARLDITADRVVRELARIAFADVRNVIGWQKYGVQFRPSEELTADAAAAVASVEAEIKTVGGAPQLKMKVRMHDKARALETLAKHFGLLLERHETKLPDEQIAYLMEVARVCLDAVTLAATVGAKDANGSDDEQAGTILH